MTLTPEERAETIERHREFPLSDRFVCESCDELWPCPTIRLLDALEAAEKDLKHFQELTRFLAREGVRFSSPEGDSFVVPGILSRFARSILSSVPSERELEEALADSEGAGREAP